MVHVARDDANLPIRRLIRVDLWLGTSAEPPARIIHEFQKLWSQAVAVSRFTQNRAPTAVWSAGVSDDPHVHQRARLRLAVKRLTTQPGRLMNNPGQDVANLGAHGSCGG